MIYQLPWGGTLLLDAEVLRTLRASVQSGPGDDEAGGQLFATFDQGCVRVVRATLGGARTRRSRCHLEPDPREEQVEIDKLFREGMHFVGNWHTHSEVEPSPSVIDIETTRDQFIRSAHELRAFILLIVGMDADAGSPWLGLVGRNSIRRLAPATSSPKGALHGDLAHPVNQ